MTELSPEMEASLREWFSDAVLQTPAGTLKLIALLDALNAERRRVVELRQALRDAEPILDENFRWHRDAQSSPGRIERAHAALTRVRAALEEQP